MMLSGAEAGRKDVPIGRCAILRPVCSIPRDSRKKGLDAGHSKGSLPQG